MNYEVVIGLETHVELKTESKLDAKHGMEKINPTPALYLASSQKAAKGRFERHFFGLSDV